MVVAKASTEKALAAAMPHNPAVLNQVTKLQDQADMYTRKIEIEKRRSEELDKQIAEMQQRVMDQRRKMGGVNAAKENSMQVTKQVKVLENRLEKARIKYNETIANNRQLRQNIDNLRRERLVFDQIYRRLEKELAEKRREMASVIEVSNVAYEARDAALAEMAQLKSQAEKEQAAFEREWRELGRLIEHDRNMKDMANGKKEQDKRGEMSLEEEAKLKKKVVKGNWNIAKDKANQQVSMEKVQSYSEAFRKIQDATGISDVDELVNTFLSAEDQNFSLFSYVNELNQEIERLEEQVAAVKAETEKYKGQGINTDNQRKKILHDLEERLERTVSRAEEYERKHEAAQRTINALKAGIQSIFARIGCDTKQNAEVLGSEGVSEKNMMQYLGIIEQRTNEVLQMFAAAQSALAPEGTGANVVASILGQGPSTPAGGAPTSIEPPSVTEEAEEDSDEEAADEGIPMSREQLKLKTLKTLQRREEGGGLRKPGPGAKRR